MVVVDCDHDCRVVWITAWCRSLRCLKSAAASRSDQELQQQKEVGGEREQGPDYRSEQSTQRNADLLDSPCMQGRVKVLGAHQ